MDDDSQRFAAEVMDELRQREDRMKYTELRKLDVSKYVEKKNGLTYMSWSWAADQLMLHDPQATWEYRWHDGVPFVRIGETAMVFCTVTAFGVSRTAQLPVMDHRNRPIPNPDAFQVNTAMQRCLAKAVALHGIGLYIYHGEDLPPDAAETRQNDAQGHDAPTDEYRAIREVADACIALHAAAVTQHDKTGEVSGFWELHRAASKVQGEDRQILWEMLAKHSAVRAAIKEYAGYAREEAARAKVAA